MKDEYIKQLEETVANLQSALDTTVKQLDKNKPLLPSWSKHLFHHLNGKKYNTWILSYPNKRKHSEYDIIMEEDAKNVHEEQLTVIIDLLRIMEMDKNKYEVYVYGRKIRTAIDGVEMIRIKCLREAVVIGLHILYGRHIDVDDLYIEE